MDYTVIYEATPTGFSAYLPDLPGCVAAGATRDEVVAGGSRQQLAIPVSPSLGLRHGPIARSGRHGYHAMGPRTYRAVIRDEAMVRVTVRSAAAGREGFDSPETRLAGR